MYTSMTEQFGWTDSGNVSTAFSLAGKHSRASNNSWN